MTKRRTKAGKESGSRPAASSSTRKAKGTPLFEREELEAVLIDLAKNLAPGDLTEFVSRRKEIEASIQAVRGSRMALFRHQAQLALDCVLDHLTGRCQQIPYYTVVLLGAALLYFTDEVDMIPDFLPNIGTLDDAILMALAFELGASGLQRYAEATGASLTPEQS